MVQAVNAPRLAEPTITIQIHELDLYHPPKISWGHEDRFYVDVDVDGEVRTTATLGKHELPWKDCLTFNVRESSIIALRVFAYRMLHEDVHIGSIEERLVALLDVTKNANIIVREFPPRHCSDHIDDTTKTRLSFSMKRTMQAREPQPNPETHVEKSESCRSQIPVTEEQPKPATERTLDSRTPTTEPTVERSLKDFHQPKDEVTQTKSSKKEFVGATIMTMVALVPSEGQIQQLVNSANTFSPLLDKLHIFLSLTDSIGDIHPYAKMATVLLTGVVKAFTSQMFFANSIKNLVEAMTDAHGFLSEANALSCINSHLEIITALSTQTVECSYFIKDVTKNTGMARVANQVLISNVERKVQGYVQRFQELRDALHQRAAITTAITVLRLYDEVQGISTQISLDAMHYAEDVHYTSVEECGTLEPDQVQLIDEITDWINGDTTERIYFLCGPAECGKTSVARRVAYVFDRLQRLGSSYFVQDPLHPHTTHHNHPRYPSSIFRTISRDVADHNPYFRRAIGEMVNKRAIRSTSNIRAQFENFILYPAQRMSATGPVVIIIDALDYCGSKESREPLLAMLANRVTELPPNFRILITSRPAADIVGAFKDKEHVITKVIADTTLPDNDSGISFSPVGMRGKLSVTPPYDDDLEEPRNSSEDEDFLEGHEVYGSLSDHSEGDSDQYTDVTLPFPLHAVEGPTPQVPPDKLIPPSRKRGMKLDEPSVILRGNGSALTRVHTVHASDARRPLKTVVTTVENPPNGPPEDTLCPEDSNGYAEGEWRAYGKRDIATYRSRGQAVSIQRAKSDRHPRRILDHCRPHPSSQMIVSRETYFVR